METILNCNLDLCLSPPSSSATADSPHNRVSPTGLPVVDPTELQVRAIIVQATKQMEETRLMPRIRSEASSTSIDQLSMKSGASPAMRRSLQSFLQKRKHRIQTLSPYTH